MRSSSQLYVFGKTRGETTIYATSKSGRVGLCRQRPRRQQHQLGRRDAAHGDAGCEHPGDADEQSRAADRHRRAPEDVAEAQRLVQAYVGEGTQVVTRLRSATPLQVMLKVRIAEMNRSLLKKIGVNLLNRDAAAERCSASAAAIRARSTSPRARRPVTGVTPRRSPARPSTSSTGGTTLGLFGHIFGTDLLGTLDLLENDGLVSTLAEPNLTALSGETASFLAGGEFPIPVSQGNNAVTIEYKQYGVGLAFTPIVLADGRISLRVRPEVSQLSDAGSVKLGGFTVPALTTRRAETTVELGSGQSFMIAGLLQNRNTNSIEKAPFLGDLPILGALFRSTSFQPRRNRAGDRSSRRTW